MGQKWVCCSRHNIYFHVCQFEAYYRRYLLANWLITHINTSLGVSAALLVKKANKTLSVNTKTFLSSSWVRRIQLWLMRNISLNRYRQSSELWSQLRAFGAVPEVERETVTESFPRSRENWSRARFFFSPGGLAKRRIYKIQTLGNVKWNFVL